MEPSGTDDVTYSFEGITLREEPPPAGFTALRVRTVLPAGTYDRAVEALFGWQMHRFMPFFRVTYTAPAAIGERVTLRMGPVHARCAVVWTIEEPDRAGFGYGTLPGHPECGEESFVLRRGSDGSVEFTVSAVSRPAAWYLRAAGPLGHRGQKMAARHYGRTLRRLVRVLPPDPR